MLLLLSLLCGGVHASSRVAGAPVYGVEQIAETVQGTVVDQDGVPVTGAAVVVVGAKKVTSTDANGFFKIANVERGAQLRISLLGYKTQTVKWDGQPLNITLEESDNVLEEAVVTAMGIRRKETSLTYATQQIKAEDLMKVQDVNVANQLEGKISGITITPSAGGAGGASKIILRGNKSIMGNSAPLIVVDGVPMTNNIRGQQGMFSGENMMNVATSEGADPLSMINPDDIESMNVLKGANAAALYGSAAANGVIMITTKKGKEGKIDINYTTNVNFESPLLTPKIQNVYGAGLSATGGLNANSWGPRIGDLGVTTLPGGSGNPYINTFDEVHLRNSAKDDVANFFNTGVTFNNSISLAGGTEKIKTYFSYANSHANGMIENNSYNRNTFAFRQSYKLWNRVEIDASLNYVQTISRNRPGGGKLYNPIYHLYITPRNIDMDYYKDNYMIENGEWTNSADIYRYVLDRQTAEYKWTNLSKANGNGVILRGPMQNWAYMQAMQNNPYWLTNVNRGKNKTDRVYGTISGKVDIYDGLSFQARVSIDHTKYNSESRRYATTFIQAGYDMEDFGRYWQGNDRTDEIYTDYLLSYNKQVNEDWSVSATAGWVGHLIRTTSNSFSATATYVPSNLRYDPVHDPEMRVNFFDSRAGGGNPLSTGTSTNWDKAALFTGQVGWRDKIYADVSYRQDWYRAFKQFHSKRGTPLSYGYFAFGGNAIISSLFEMPDWINYFKYRASYSQVGNSIPNIVFTKGSENLATGSVTPSAYSQFKNPKPEQTNSFETGIEMLLFNNNLQFDFTFYNAISKNQYMMATNASGKTEPVNSGSVRNRGFETTIGYDFRLGQDLRWKTALNFSYDNNKILKTAYEEDGSEKDVSQTISGVRVRYREGGSMGDMYVTDIKRDENGVLLLTDNMLPQSETEKAKLYTKFIGNMNSKYQLGWSNTFTYKDFQLFFLINGRIGGKVVSMTEGYLDYFGQSQRSADARLQAEANGLYTADGRQAMQIVGRKQIGQDANRNPVYEENAQTYLVALDDYYRYLGGGLHPEEYVYDATNFRLRELSLSYTFRNLLGEGKNLSLSFVGRNLFFIYKDAPVDPDVSLSTQNGLSGFELFNMPSARSFGFSAKINF